MKPRLFMLSALILIAAGSVCLALNEANRSRVLTTDSIIYADTARHLAANQGASTDILTFDDTVAPAPQTQWPPFYPMVMSPLVHFGVDPIFAGRIVSAVSFGLTVLLIGLWLWRLAGPLAGLAGATLLTTLPGVASIAAAVWADSLYTLLVTGVAWLGWELISQQHRQRAWLALGVLIGLAILTKYLGLLLFGVLAVIGLVTLHRTRKIKTVAMNVLSALLSAGIFLMFLLLRNVHHHKPIGGAARDLSTQPFPSIVRDLVSTVPHDLARNPLWIAVIILTVVGLIGLIAKKSSRTNMRPMLGISLMAVTYWIGLVAARLTIDTDPIYTRFTMPVYPLVVVVVILLISGSTRALHVKAAQVMLVLLAVLSLTWSVKRFNFSAGAWTPNISQRTRTIERLTTSRDLIIGDASREYNLFLGRTVIQLSSDDDQKLTPELLTTLKHRWQSRFNRIILAVAPSDSSNDYGQFVAAAAKGLPSDSSLHLIEGGQTLTLYEVR